MHIASKHKRGNDLAAVETHSKREEKKEGRTYDKRKKERRKKKKEKKDDIGNCHVQQNETKQQ